MAQLGGTFDANSVAPSAPREIIPPGKYIAQIVQSEMRDTKSGNGQMLWLELDILDGEHAGRKLWERLNLKNPNAQAVEIAERTLSAICHATGQMTVSDSEQLHYKPMTVTVKVRPAGPDKSGAQRDAQNEIGGYEPGVSMGSAVAKAEAGWKRPAPAAAPVATQASKPAAAAPPWKRAG